jgi:chaperonin GroES
MKLRPLHDRIIVKRLEEERKSAGGIVIPDTAAEKPSMGEVIAAGPGKTDDNGKLVPMGVKMEGADYLHMREDDVIGVIA